MAAGIGEANQGGPFTAEEAQALTEQPRVEREQLALLTALAIQAVTEIDEDGVRIAMAEMSEKARRKFVASAQKVARIIAEKRGSQTKLTPVPEAETEAPAEVAVSPVPAVDAPEVVEIAQPVNPEPVSEEPAEVISPQLAGETQGTIQEVETAASADIEDETHHSASYDQNRVENLGRRISELWKLDNGEFPLTLPLDESKAKELVSMYAEYIPTNGKKKDPRHVRRFVRLLEGMNYGEIARLESEEQGEEVNPTNIRVFFSQNLPNILVKYLEAQVVGATEPYPEADTQVLQNLPQAPISAVDMLAQVASTTEVTIIDPPYEEPETPVVAPSPAMLAQQQGRAGRIQQGSHYIPAPAHSNLANPDRLTYSVEPARIPRSLEIAREYGVVLDEEATPFDPELAEIKLFEIQSDGDPRHHNGAVDAQDIADAYGVDVKRVRRMADDVIFALTSQGKLHGSSGAKRKRPGGTQSKHYSQQVRDILLTRVKEEALSQSGETN